MKILDTLQAALSKMGEKEILQFHAYATYKNEKKQLRFLDMLRKYIDKELDTRYILIYLKTKRVKKLDIKCNNLFQLLLKFWKDNPPKANLQLQISQLMLGARLLIKKGLIKEGLDLYMKAGALAENGELFSFHHEILRASLYWSSHLNPKNIDAILKESQEKQALVERKMEMLFEAKVFSTKQFSKIYISKEWSKNFYEKTIEQIYVQLDDKNCPVRSKLIYHNLLSNIYSTPNESNWELIEFHKQELIRNAEILYKTDPNCLPLFSSIVNLLAAYHSLKKIPEFQLYLTKLRKLAKKNNERDKNIEALHHKIELLHCNLTGNYTDAEHSYIPDAIKFIDHYQKNNTIKSFWSIFTLCFEHYLSTGNYEMAASFLSKIEQEDKQNKLNTVEKNITILYEILYHFELNNNELVAILIKKAIPLYDDSSNNNKGGKVLLNYLSKLNKTSDKNSRIPIYRSLKNDLEETFKNYAFARNIGVNNIVDWIDAKINKFKTIQAYIDAKNVEGSKFL